MSAVLKQPDASRQAYYGQIAKYHMTPLWESLHLLVPRAPTPKMVPAIWRYAQLRDLLMESGKVISAAEAIRRVLILENPGLPGSSSITSNLYAGLQLILPGEIAPSHRHTQLALRFIVEGKSAWTAVDGERIPMSPGDYIITPTWTWHDHGNAADGEPVVWLDGLDAPLIAQLDAGFCEDYPEAEQPVHHTDGYSIVRHGYNMAPVRHKAKNANSPILKYPYERSREALERLHRMGDLDAWDGVKLRYINPATGGYPMAAIAPFLQLLPKGFKGKPYRTTESTVFCVVEGRGSVKVGSKSFDYEPHDVFCAPSWEPVTLESPHEDVVLFSFSNLPLLDTLGLWREERK
ncbi:MAG: gentisate 1,2-dioxygenase [Burkholderiaceae bacterium]|jgi:gentisate 1,2-dioxygenase|nr:gentisate 1,2-dioxygenase [Burkholderiaceae bacterium]